jgi:hypothetical protein
MARGSVLDDSRVKALELPPSVNFNSKHWPLPTVPNLYSVWIRSLVASPIALLQAKCIEVFGNYIAALVSPGLRTQIERGQAAAEISESSRIGYSQVI